MPRRRRRNLSLVAALCAAFVVLGAALEAGSLPPSDPRPRAVQEESQPAPPPILSGPGPMSLSFVGMQAHYEHLEQERLAAIAAEEAAAREASARAEAEAAAAAAAATARVQPAPSNATPVITSGSVGDFLACTRAHESDSAGGYSAVSPGGTYRGAYQFVQSTWDGVAAGSNRPDLVGVDPATASPADQDAMAASLYAAAGNRPWGGRC